MATTPTSPATDSPAVDRETLSLACLIGTLVLTNAAVAYATLLYAG